MAETIDKVQVEVEATAKGTSAVFKQLESQLSALKSALNAIDTSKLSQAAKASKTLTVNTSGMTKAEKDVSNSVNKIKQALAGLQSYKNAALGGDNSSLISFNRQVIKIQSSIDVLEEKLRELGDTNIPTEAFTNLDSQIEEAKAKVAELKAEEENYWNSHTSIDSTYTDLQMKIADAENELDNLIDKQTEMKSSGSAYTDPFASYRESVSILRDEVTNTSNEVSSAVEEMNSTPVDIDTGETTSKFEGIREKAEEAAVSILKMFGTGIKNGLKGLKNSLSGIKNALSGIGKTSSFASSGFGKILKYGFGIRSLYVLVRRLREAVKDSFTELQNSGADFETTRANIESLKNSLTTLKYQFGAAFEPIFNSVAPALQTLINYLVAAMNTLSAFIAKITGKSTYSKAVVATSDIASNTGSAADSAKELNKQLAGFDELNNLTSSSGGSGGGGSGGSSDTSGVTYESASVDSALSSFWSSLAEDVKNGDWKKVGTTISDKLSEAMESIPWDTIFAKAKTFGTDLASFLNGLITPRLFSALGTTIGNSIKTALNFLNSFGEEFEWDEFGDSIAAGINAFIQTNPLDLAVTTFNTWANGILDTLNSAVEGVSWKTLGQHIADGIGKVDAFNIAWKLGKLVTNLVNALYDLVSNKNTWKNLGQKVADGINGFFAGFDGAKLAKTCNAIIDGLITTLSTIITQTSWSSIADDIVQVIGNLDIGTIALVIGGFTLAKMALDAAIVAVKGVLTTSIATGIGGLTVSGLTAAVAVVAAISLGWKWGTQIYEWATGEEVNQGMAEEIKDIFTGFTVDGIDFDLTDFITFTFGSDNYWNNFWGDIGEDIYDGVQSIKSKLKSVGNNIIEGIKTGVVDKIKGIGTWVKDKFQTIVDKVKDFFGVHSPSTVFKTIGEDLIEGLKNGLKSAVNKIKNWIKTNVTDKIKGFFNGVKTITISIAGKVLSSFTDAKAKWDDFKNKTAELVANAKEKIAGKLDELTNKWKNFPTDVKKLYTDAKEKVAGAIDKLKTTWNNWVPAVKDLVTNAREAAEDKVKGSIQWLKDKWNGWLNTDDTKTLKANATDEGTIATTQKNWDDAKFKKKDLSVAWDSNSLKTLSEWNSVKDDNDVVKKIKLEKAKSSNSGFAGALEQWNSVVDDDNVVKTVKLQKGDGFKDTYDKWNAIANTKESELKVTFNNSFTSSLTTAWNGMVTRLENALSSLIKKGKINSEEIPGRLASGGAYYGGSWHSIPQFASGTFDALKHGSVFAAGENGPEVVGHINGRTEVLNRSQIASTMFQAVTNGMRQFKNAQMVQPPQLAYANGAIATYSSDRGNDNSNELIAEQNRLIAEQNRLLGIIAEKDVTISSRDVFNATRSESNNYFNRTGNSPFLF